MSYVVDDGDGDNDAAEAEQTGAAANLRQVEYLGAAFRPVATRAACPDQAQPTYGNGRLLGGRRG